MCTWSATQFLLLMIRMHTPLNGAPNPGVVIGRKCQGSHWVPLVTSTRPPSDKGAHLMPAVIKLESTRCWENKECTTPGRRQCSSPQSPQTTFCSHPRRWCLGGPVGQLGEHLGWNERGWWDKHRQARPTSQGEGWVQVDQQQRPGQWRLVKQVGEYCWWQQTVQWGEALPTLVEWH